MKIKIIQSTIALLCALSFLGVSVSTNTAFADGMYMHKHHKCWWVKGHWFRKHWIPGHWKCCKWIPGHHFKGEWIPAHKYCWIPRK